MNIAAKTLASLALLACCVLAHATTYTVTNTGDNGGTNPAAHSGTGTLRQAIVDSNADGGSQNIAVFNIPASGLQTITLAARLPFITSNLAIDGFSQPGTVANTNPPDAGGLNGQLMIQIDGGNTVDLGFFISGAANAGIAGLVIDGFTSVAIEQNGSGSTLGVSGCYIGVQPNGTAFPSGYGNAGYGIRNDAGSAYIGGLVPGRRSVISGNQTAGIFVGQVIAPVSVFGNLIGTDATGTVAITTNNNNLGIWLPANVPNIVIGCTDTDTTCTDPGHPARNVISGSRAYAIAILDTYTQGTGGLQIKGNYMGTDWTGTKPLPNGDATAGGCPTYCGGIQLQGSASIATPASIIGGLNPGEGNLIAYNNGYGITGYAGAIGDSFDHQGDAIHNNRGTDVVFNLSQGRVPNTPGGAGTGTNRQQNYPAIQSASVSGTPGNLTLNVTYLIDSTTSNSTYPLRVDFYVDIDEGSGAYLVSDSYPSTNAQMPRTVSLALPASVQSLVGIVVSATDANGYSSELSPSLVFDRIFYDGFEMPR